MMYSLVHELAETGARLRVPVALTCRVLGFSKQGYYKWLSAGVCQRDWDDAHLANAAIDVHGDDPEFGYRLIADELEHDGYRACERRTWRVCSQNGIRWVITGKGEAKGIVGATDRDRSGPA